MKINLDRARELSTKKQSLEDDGKNLIYESELDYIELLSYNFVSMDICFWDNRLQYFDLMKNFLEERISREQFENEYGIQYREDSERRMNFFGNLEIREFSYDPKCQGFFELIAGIMQYIARIDYMTSCGLEDEKSALLKNYRQNIEEISLAAKNFE